MRSDLLNAVLTLGVVALLAVLAHIAIWRAVIRFGWRTTTAQQLRYRVRWPARLSTATIAVLVALPTVSLRPEARDTVTHVFVILLILTLAWTALGSLRVFEDAALQRFDVSARDNLRARRRRTQVTLLRRVSTVLIAFLAAAGILLTFPTARTVGASLLASAGAAGLIAGLAARSTLGNMIAGLQIAFAEPIRLDDVVVVEGEWGNIEEITLTYVVVRIWDKRRLVLPTSYFVETPFQNWTRKEAQVLGAVVLHLDHRAPVQELREVLEDYLRTDDRFDGDGWVLQVTDTTETTMVVRALMTAEDAPTAWDLRCAVREHLIAWLRDHHPEALPTLRHVVTSLPGEYGDASIQGERPHEADVNASLFRERDGSHTTEGLSGALDVPSPGDDRGGEEPGPRT